MWVSPTGFADPSLHWTNEPNAYDENVATYASHSVMMSGWSGFLWLNHATLLCSKIRIYFVNISDMASLIDIDCIDTDDNIIHIAEVNPQPLIDQWNEYNIPNPPVLIKAIKIRAWHPSLGMYNLVVSEADFLFGAIKETKARFKLSIGKR